jgi:hypothetical protein
LSLISFFFPQTFPRLNRVRLHPSGLDKH